MSEAVHAEPTEVWGRACAELKGSLPESTYRIWIAPLRPLSVQGGTLRLGCPATKQAWIERRYAALIRAALERAGSPIREVAFGRAEGDATPGGDPTGVAIPQPMRAKTFERFVIGPGNRMAHAAALAVAEAPGQAYNPLFLFGPPGLGKSHLLGAVAGYLRSRFPGLRICCTTAEAFTSEFVAAIAASDLGAFKRRHRDVDALLIDDVHFLEGKERTQEEFFHTFNSLHDAGGQIVLSSDRHPGRLAALTDRLRDRFEWGLLIELEQPDAPTRRAVLELLRRESPAVSIDEEATTALAGQPIPNLRQLEGAFTRLAAGISLGGECVSEDHLVTQPIAESPDDEAIIRAVATEYDVTSEQLIGRGRTARVVEARHLAMYLCRELAGLSLPRIAAAFGGRDHTTVLHAIRRTTSHSADDANFNRAIDRLKASLAPKASTGNP